MRHLRTYLLATLLLLLAAGQGAMAETKTYTVSGGNDNSPTKFYAQFTDGSSPSNKVSWMYNSDAEITFNLRTDLILTLSNTDKHLIVEDNAIGGRGATTLTVSGNNYYYIYRVRLLTADGNVIQLNANGEAVTQGGVSECDYWNMTKSFSRTFANGILFSKIEVSYDTAIPITDAVISGLNASYPVSNAAITPTPTVTWHGTTLTKNTHYTLSYQNNSSAGTATVKATGKGIFSTSTNVSANYTLNWATYTVRFNANGGSGTMADQAFTYNTAQALSANAFTRIGYTFDGWSTTANGTVVYTDGQSVSNLTATNGATVDLYAQWTPITYTVRFNKNSDGASGTMSDQAFTYGTAQNLTANAFTAPTGYLFAGWSTNANGTGNTYTNGQSVSNLTAENGAIVDLYAQWRMPSGTCGNPNVNNGMDVTWALTDTDTDGTYETLTISGSGNMADYTTDNQPWAAFKPDITIVVIEDGVTRIGIYAFYQFTALTSVSIASSVTTIRASAFLGCTNLTTVSGAGGVTRVEGSSTFDETAWYNALPDGLTYVGHVAYNFKGDGTSVTLDAATTQIYDFCFQDSHITSIIIPASVERIGNRAFANSYSLNKIYVLRNGSSREEITKLGTDAFKYVQDQGLDIVVPDAAYSLYSNANDWSPYRTKLSNGYTVTCDAGITATTSNNGPLVEQGETVTLSGTGTIPDGYAFAGYSVKDADNNDVTVTETSGVYSFTMPAANVTVSAQWVLDFSVKYIDENGIEQVCSNYTIIQSSNSSQTLGDSNNNEAWYVVTGDITVEGGIKFLDQAVHLILRNGSKLTVTGKELECFQIAIYGQSGGSGSILVNNCSVDGIYASNGIITINGGNVSVSDCKRGFDSASGQVTINGGNVSVSGCDSGIFAGQGFTINGGNVSVSGRISGIYAENGNIIINGGNISASGDSYGFYAPYITLGWTNSSDSIYASSYFSYNNSIRVRTGQTLTDGTTTYTTTYTLNADAIAGKTLRPYLSPTEGTPITLVQGTKDGVTAWWGTFCNTKHYVLSEGATAYTLGSDYKLYRLGVDGRTIPKNTAVVIIASEATIQTYDIGSSSNLLVTDHAPGGNRLQGSDSAVAVSGLSGTPYVLSKDANGTIGFRKYTGTEIPANKAYYVVQPIP